MLDEIYGIILYQEQVSMMIVNVGSHFFGKS